jgi:hypothetical protein
VATCRSILARRDDLDRADPTRLTGSWFAHVRDGFVTSDRRFTTVRPFRDACRSTLDSRPPKVTTP